jgi:hypothetical protein
MQTIPRTPPPTDRVARSRPCVKSIIEDRPTALSSSISHHDGITPKSTSGGPPPTPLDHLVGIEDTPSHPRNAGGAPHYCPICMLHFPMILQTRCCKQFLCGPCAKGLFGQRGLVPQARPAVDERNTARKLAPFPLEHFLAPTPDHSSKTRPHDDDLSSSPNVPPASTLFVRSIIAAASGRPVVPCPYCSRTLRATIVVPTVPPHIKVRSPRPSDTSKQASPDASLMMQTPVRQVLPRLDDTPRSRTTANNIADMSFLTHRSPYLPLNVHRRGSATRHGAAADPTKFAALKELPQQPNQAAAAPRPCAESVESVELSTGVGASFEELRQRLVRFQLSADYRPVAECDVKHDPDRKQERHAPPQPTLLSTSHVHRTQTDYVGISRAGGGTRRRPVAGAPGRSHDRLSDSRVSENTARRDRSRSGSRSPSQPNDQTTPAQSAVSASEQSWCPIM